MNIQDMKSPHYRSIEFLITFVLIPVSFAVEYNIWIKIAIAVLGFAYMVFVLLKIEKNEFKMAPNLKWRQFFKTAMLKLLVIAVITILYMWFVDRDNLFNVLLNKPGLWVMILFIYSFFSVYPQELIYRTFFFQRYESLFKNERVFVLLNATLFSLGHIFFKNTLVMILTFMGGLLFAMTYKRTKSTLLVSVEHAIYGCWLFTVGMGDMLGFPS